MRRATDRFLSLFSLGLVAAATIGCAHAGPQSSNPIDDPALSFEYFTGLTFDQSIPTPKHLLGYEIGEHFTRHLDLVRTLEHFAKVSDRAIFQPYGQSHQRRSLNILTISSPENLDNILADNKKLTDPANLSRADLKRITRDKPAIVWFSFNVHGNEASSSETAIQLAYTLIASTNKEIEDILDKVVLIIDPMLNPDGRERYISFNDNTTSPTGPNPSTDATEHHEPWPSGRTNHYNFDLNRDWIWLTQPESRARIEVYRARRPQLHIDYHEQGYRSPYFFGAGEDPYNTNIPEETKEWVGKYGSANAKVFDERGLVYATRERFDYLYPGYGKVLPCYHGAVGMLCEQAGHGMAGLAIKVSDQYTLTLRERAQHHFLTAMSYLETTAANREEQNQRFARYFEESLNLEPNHPAAIVIHTDNDPALLQKVWDFTQAQGISIDSLASNTNLNNLHNYLTGEQEDPVQTNKGAWIIRTDQPMGRLVRAAFERSTEVTDKETYDITGWSLPVSFGLHAHYAMKPLGENTNPLTEWTPKTPKITGKGSVALVIDAAQHHFPRAVGVAMRHELFCRRAGDEIELEGQAFSKGSLITHTSRNQERDLDAFIQDTLAAGLSLHRAGTNMTTAGHVLGANDNRPITLPKVLLLRGAPGDPYSFGQHWHLLDIEQTIPHTVTNFDNLSSINLDAYTTIILPNTWGSLDVALSESTIATLKAWTRAGGALIATGSSARWASKTFLDINETSDDEDNDATDDEDIDEEPIPNELTWQERQDKDTDDNVPGPLLAASVDTTHPLGAGVREWVGVLKRTKGPLPVKDNGYVVARFTDSPLIGGVISEENQEKLAGEPFITHHPFGRGTIICFSDDTTTRAFMHGGMRLLMNAIIFGHTL